ncbi:MAG: sialic acid TRAP transporter substrate-binding protein SiaP [Sneathiella sp.]
MKKFTRRHMVAGAALTAVAFAAMGTSAQAGKVLKWAHVYESGSAYHTTAEWAAEEIKKRTDGRYEIKVFPASSLGKEVDINEGLNIGSVDIIYTGPAFAAQSYGPLAISDYPFILRDYNHWKAYRDSDLFTEMGAGYKKATGNTITALTYYGARHVTANKPIMVPKDMTGLKIRVPNAPVYMMFPKAVGANPTPMAFSEVYLALQQGVVDAQENPLPTIKFKKFYEVQSNINLTGHITNSLVTVISGATLGGMSDADAAVLREVTRAAAERASNEIDTAEQNLASWFRDQGVTVNVVDRKPFMKAVEPDLTSSDVPYTMEQYERFKAL